MPVKIKPSVQNKYNLTIASIRKLVIVDKSKIKPPRFWRNDVISAWCISCEVGGDNGNSYWIGIYDDDAPAHAGKFRFAFSSYGGMCGYTFNCFFKEDDIENTMDLKIQELFLEKINLLIDEGVLAIQ